MFTLWKKKSEFFYTHQNSACACLSRNQFSGPILRLAHEVAVRGSVRILALGDRSQFSQFLDNLFVLSFISTGSNRVEVISHPFYLAIPFSVRIFFVSNCIKLLGPEQAHKRALWKSCCNPFPANLSRW